MNGGLVGLFCQQVALEIQSLSGNDAAKGVEEIP